MKKNEFDAGEVKNGYICIMEMDKETKDYATIHDEPCTDIGTQEQCVGCEGELQIKMGVIECKHIKAAKKIPTP